MHSPNELKALLRLFDGALVLREQDTSKPNGIGASKHRHQMRSQPEQDWAFARQIETITTVGRHADIHRFLIRRFPVLELCY